MFKLLDGREQLYQWDSNRQLIVNDNSITEVHFCNKTDDCSLVVTVKDGIADIPNVLLQNSYPIKAYAYINDGYTKVEQCFKVKARTKPSDYVYTETEVKRYEDFETRLKELESSITTTKIVYVDATGLSKTPQFVPEEYIDMFKDCLNGNHSNYVFYMKTSSDNYRDYEVASKLYVAEHFLLLYLHQYVNSSTIVRERVRIDDYQTALRWYTEQEVYDFTSEAKVTNMITEALNSIEVAEGGAY